MDELFEVVAGVAAQNGEQPPEKLTAKQTVSGAVVMIIVGRRHWLFELVSARVASLNYQQC